VHLTFTVFTAVMCDVPDITDRKTFANRTVTVLYDKWEKTSLLIDIATPNYSKVKTEKTEKNISKYKELDIAVSRMRKVRKKLCQL
jgi:hypothetical protein